METTPTTAQLIARAEKAEKDLESSLKASERLSRHVQTSLDLLKIVNDNNGFEPDPAARLIMLYLRNAVDVFDTWDEIPF